MGQQQLLLIILGVIVVGIAVAVGITMFDDMAVQDNREAVQADLEKLAARAQQYWRRSEGLGGGQGSFQGLAPFDTGIKILTSRPTNDNGQYSVVGVSTNFVQLQGVGVEKDHNGLPVEVQVTVYSDSMSFVKIN